MMSRLYSNKLYLVYWNYNISYTLLLKYSDICWIVTNQDAYQRILNKFKKQLRPFFTLTNKNVITVLRNIETQWNDNKKANAILATL